MKQHTQLRMEIRRQGGETIMGMVPVNQKGYQLGSASIYFNLCTFMRFSDTSKACFTT